MKKISLALLLAGMGTMLYSCASSIPRADEAHDTWAQKHWSGVQLSEARSIYVSNCSGCHNLHSPAEYTRDEWVKLFGEMAIKTSMSSRDSLAVLVYLQTYSKGNDLSIR